MDNIKKKIEEKDTLIFREKLKRRADVARAVDKRKAMEKTLEDLHEWVDELHALRMGSKGNRELVFFIVLIVLLISMFLFSLF